MSDEKQTPTPMVVPQGSIRNPEFKDVYTNQSRIGVSQFDFSMTFSKIIEPSAGITIVEDQAVVRMSPHQFKAFIQNANTALEAWENVFGKIEQTTKSRTFEQMRDGMRKLKDIIDKAAI